jgi:hypothetical protein
MREVRFVAVSQDGRGLVLGDADGGEYIMAIDDAVRAAVRQDRSRLGHLHVETEALRPRDIQARIRAGETAEEVSAAAGIPLEKVRRYEGPVLAEREHVAAQAQSATVRDTGSAEGPAPRLGELMQSRFEPLGIDLAVLGWDAWRREDGRWVVRLVYPDSARVRAALWLYDPERRVVLPQDAQARALVDGTAPPDPRARVAAPAGPRAQAQTPGSPAQSPVRESPPAPVRRLASVPREPDETTSPEPGETGAVEAAAAQLTPHDVQLPLDDATASGAAPAGGAGDVPPGAGDAPGGPGDATGEPGETTRPNGAATGTEGTADGQGTGTPRHAADSTRKPGRTARRAAVPSWDDIVFGTRKKD